jgi:hypothetical protein
MNVNARGLAWLRVVSDALLAELVRRRIYYEELYPEGLLSEPHGFMMEWKVKDRLLGQDVSMCLHRCRFLEKLVILHKDGCYDEGSKSHCGDHDAETLARLVSCHRHCLVGLENILRRHFLFVFGFMKGIFARVA